MENLNTSVENTKSESGSLPAISRFARTLVIQQLRMLCLLYTSDAADE